MDKIKYLMSLRPEQSLIAALLIAVSFLSTGWGVSEWNYSKYRAASEKDKTSIQQAHSEEVIRLYNRIIDGQTKRQDILDSTIKEVKVILENKKFK